MTATRKLVIAPTVSLTSSVSLSTVVDIEGWARLGVECDIVARSGILKIVVELGADDNSFYPETIGPNVETLTPSGNDLEVPLYRCVHTWNDDNSFAFGVPCNGYKRARIKVTAGTSASAAFYINRLGGQF